MRQRPKNSSAEEETSKGSKAYKKAKKSLTTWEKAVKEAKTCEDLEIAHDDYISAAIEKTMQLCK